MRTLIHRAFALLVSACLVTGLLPASALATSGGTGTESSGSSSGSGTTNTPALDTTTDYPGGDPDDMTWTGEGIGVGTDGKVPWHYNDPKNPSAGFNAKASTGVYGYAYDPDFEIKECQTDINFPNAQAAHDYTMPGSSNGGPMTVKLFGGDGNYDVYWEITPGEYDSNGNFVPRTDPSTGDPLTVKAEDPNSPYTGLEADPTTELTTFQYTIPTPQANWPTNTAGCAGNSGGLQDDTLYKFTVHIQQTGNPNLVAEADIYVSTFGNYKFQTLPANATVSNPNLDNPTNVTGYIYTDSGNLIFPALSKTDVPDTYPAYTALTDAAAKKVDKDTGAAAPEAITDPVELIITGLTDKPANKDPYLFNLEVQLELDPAVIASKGLKEGDTVTVYRYYYDEVEKTDKVQELTGEIVHALDANDPRGELFNDDMTPKLAVKTTISKTGVDLGTFAIGYQSRGTYTIRGAVDTDTTDFSGKPMYAYGQVTPTDTKTYPLEKSAKITFFPMAGYELKSINVFVDGMNYDSANPSNAFIMGDVQGNVFVFDPAKYWKASNLDNAVVTFRFDKANPAAPTYDLNVSLKGEGAAAGDMSFVSGDVLRGLDPTEMGIPAGDFQKHTLTIGGQETATVKTSATGGVLFEFNPGNNSRVKSVTVDGVQYTIAGTSFFLGTLTKNTSVEVVYEIGVQESASHRTVTASIAKGKNPAVPTGYLTDPTTGAQSQGPVYYTVPYGNSQSISAEPALVDPTNAGSIERYSLRYARVHFDGMDKTMADGGYLDLTNMVDGNTLNSALVTLQLFNIIGNAEVEFAFKVPATTLTITVENPKYGEVETYLDKAAAWEKNATTYVLEEDEALRIKITPDAARAILGSVFLDGKLSLTHYMTEHKNSDGLIEYYTFTVMKTDANISDYTWTMPGGVKEKDKVLTLPKSSHTISIKYDPFKDPAPSYYTITTKVGGIGGGQITPTLSVKELDSADVWFFPDEGYKVDKVYLDGVEVGAGKLAEGGHKLEFEKITKSHTVEVTFTNGEDNPVSPDRWTIYPTSSGGGFISPQVDTPVYGGKSQTFRFFPMTGYEVSKVYVGDNYADTEVIEFGAVGQDVLNIDENEYTFVNVGCDKHIHVTFAKEGSTAERDPAYTVIVSPGDNGTTSPVGATTVAAGKAFPITIKPDDGYTVDSVIAYSMADPSLYFDITNTMENGTVFLYDVYDSMEVVVKFRPLNNGETWKPGTDDAGFIILHKENADIDEGAILQPEIEGLRFYKEKYRPYATTPAYFTVMVREGFTLDAITLNGKKIEYSTTGDGVYSVRVPKEQVTQDMLLKVTTKQETPSAVQVSTKTVTVQWEGQGTVSPSGTDGILYVESGKPVTFNFLPEQGWKVDTVYVNNTPVSISGLTYTIPAIATNTHIRVVFSDTGNPGYDQVGENGGYHEVQAIGVPYEGTLRGNITPSEVVKVMNNGDISFLLRPDSGYQAHVYSDSSCADAYEITGRMSGNTLTLNDITANRKVWVKFMPSGTNSEKYHTVITQHGRGGWISPEGSTRVKAGAQQVISIMPDSGYKIKSVSINSDDVTSQFANSPTLSQTLTIDKDMLITVVFEKGTSPSVTRHTISAMTHAGGLVSPNRITLPDGESATFTFTPLQGYTLQEVQIDGGSSAGTGVTLTPDRNTYGSYTLTGNLLTVANVNSDHEIVGIYKKDHSINPDSTHYYVFVTAGAGGSVSPNSAVTVPAGGSQTFSILPDPGYKVKTIRVFKYTDDPILGTGGTQISEVSNFNGNAYTLFNIVSNMQFAVEFEATDQQTPAVTTFDITASSSMGGTISPSGVTKVAHGAMAYFSFIPATGYKLSYVQVDGKNIPAAMITNNQYVFTGVESDHTIHSVYCPKDDDVADFVSINVEQSTGGAITPANDPDGSSVLVRKGEDAVFTIGAYYGYKIAEVYVNGNSIGKDFVDNLSYKLAGSQLTLKKVQTDMSIRAVFEKSDVVGNQAPDYTTITVVGNEPGKGGSVSYNPGTSVIEELTDGEVLDVSIIPDDGKKPSSITITYPDGTKKEITDPDELKKIWEDGYISLEPGQVNGGVIIEVEWTDTLASDELEIEQGKLNPAAYHEIVSTYEGPGITNAHGRLKIANGASARFTMIPNSGTELTSLKVDNTEKMANLQGGRVYTFPRGDNYNHTIHAIYGPVDEVVDIYTISASANEGGRVSPTTQKVASGQSAVINFFPDDGYKLKGFSLDGAFVPYSAPSYTIAGVSDNHTIGVQFEPLAENETPPFEVTPVKVKATVASGSAPGEVSPTEVEVPLGSTYKFALLPGNGCDVESVTFNGKQIYLPSDSKSITVTPVQRDNGEDNELVVKFKQRSSATTDVTVTASSMANTNPDFSDGSGKVSPTQRRLPYGGTATFYIIPDPGCTIDEVLVDGRHYDWHPVTHPDQVEIDMNDGYDQDKVDSALNSASIRGESGITNVISYNGQATTSGAVYRGGANISQMSLADLYYSSYSVTVPSVTKDIGLEVSFRKLPVSEDKNTGKDVQFTYVAVPTHNVTITSTGGGTVNPLGQLYLPVGAKETISFNAFSGYFLESVKLEKLNADGSVNEVIDVTDKVNGNSIEFTMGITDCNIKAKFSIVGTPPLVSIGPATGKMPELDADGNIKYENGQPVYKEFPVVSEPTLPGEFQRGESYTFVFTPIDEDAGLDENGNPKELLGPNGRQLYIKSIIYNGNTIDVSDPDNDYFANFADIVLATDGNFEIIWEELPEDKQLEDKPDYYITTEVEGEGGKVLPEGRSPVFAGDDFPVTLSVGQDGWLVDSVVDWYIEDGATEATPHTVESIDYSTGTYWIRNVDRDHRVVATFVKGVRLYVEWDNSQGFVTPNTAPNEFIYVEQGASQVFFVAPHFGYDVKSVTVDAYNATGDLRQTAEAQTQIKSITGNKVVYFDEGQGVQGVSAKGNESEEEALDRVGENGEAAEQGLVSEEGSEGSDLRKQSNNLIDNVMSLFGVDRTASDVVSSANTNRKGISAQNQNFAYAYEFTTPELDLLNPITDEGGNPLLGAASQRLIKDASGSEGDGSEIGDAEYKGIRVEALFEKDETQNPEDNYHTITGSVIMHEDGSGHGQITPVTAQVEDGKSFTFSFTPDSGYRTAVLGIDGQTPKEYTSNEYTFENVTTDHVFEVGFYNPDYPDSTVGRLLRKLQGLAQTGDMNGPAIGLLLIIAAGAIMFCFLSTIRRKQEDDK